MPAEPDEDARPPPLGSWRRLYVLVIGVLVVEIGLLWVLAGAYR